MAVIIGLIVLGTICIGYALFMSFGHRLIAHLFYRVEESYSTLPHEGEVNGNTEGSKQGREESLVGTEQD
jgi:hypothetical protein